VAEPVVRRQVIREETARAMISTLRLAVETGTGVKAQLEHYPVAGKTGTAQKIVNGAYVHDRHFASFIGFLPADDPQLCIGIFIDEPKNGRYGGETAAPVFQAIARQAASYQALPVAPMENTGAAADRNLAERTSVGRGASPGNGTKL
jgi:cell division protein FtsI/penicillin-binding protein 2